MGGNGLNWVEMDGKRGEFFGIVKNLLELLGMVGSG